MPSGRTESYLEKLYRVKAFKPVTKTSAYTAVVNDEISFNTTGGSFPITLPPTPSENDEIRFKNIATKEVLLANPLTILRNGKTIGGIADDISVSTLLIEFRLVYNNGSWRVAL